MPHVLIIDDDPPLRRMLAKILEAANYTVTEAGDGMQGAQLYRANLADVVLCDIVMKHSGLALIRILHEQYPGCRIIAISGVDPHRLAYALECGAVGTLRKPFSPTELLETVAKVLATPSQSAAPADDAKT